MIMHPQAPGPLIFHFCDGWAIQLKKIVADIFPWFRLVLFVIKNNKMETSQIQHIQLTASKFGGFNDSTSLKLGILQIGILTTLSFHLDCIFS